MELSKMYDKTWYKHKHTWMYIAAALLALGGILTFVLGVASVAGWQQATATVHLVINSDYISVSFVTLDGQEVETQLHDFDTSLADGKTTGIRYRIDDPTKVQLYGTDITLGVCLFVAALMTAILATTYWRDDRKRYKCLASVAQKGQPVQCDVLNVFHDAAAIIGRNKKNRYRLECAYYPETPEAEEKKIWVFLSDSFLNTKGKFAGHVTTYVNFDNPDEYYVDLSTLTIEESKDASQNEDAI